MFGALAMEKNVSEEKAKAAMTKCRKLESKLGLSLASTGLARKLNETRRRLEEEVSTGRKMASANGELESDLVRACAEIKVLERALEAAQIAFDSSSSSSSSSPSSSSSSSRKPALRDQLLYQLALKKEESHSLALELAHKTTLLRDNAAEIGALKSEVREIAAEAETADAHVGHLTTQIIAQDLQVRNMEETARGMERENGDLLKHVERIATDSARLQQEVAAAAAKAMADRKAAAGSMDSLAQAKAEHAEEVRSLVKSGADSRRVVKLAEERLRAEVATRVAMEERAAASEERSLLSAGLEREAELLRRGMGDEAAARRGAEERAGGAEARCSAVEQRERAMKEEMERTLDGLERMTRERDAALAEVVSLSSVALRSGVDRNEIERLATSKHLLQKALMEQLGNCKGQLNRERELRKKLEEELRAARREGRAGNVGRGGSSPGAMMIASVLSAGGGGGGGDGADGHFNDGNHTATTPTGTIRSRPTFGTPVTPALPERMLKIEVRGIAGLPSRCFARQLGGGGAGGKEGTVYLEFSSTVSARDRNGESELGFAFLCRLAFTKRVIVNPFLPFLSSSLSFFLNPPPSIPAGRGGNVDRRRRLHAAERERHGGRSGQGIRHLQPGPQHDHLSQRRHQDPSVPRLAVQKPQRDGRVLHRPRRQRRGRGRRPRAQHDRGRRRRRRRRRERHAWKAGENRTAPHGAVGLGSRAQQPY